MRVSPIILVIFIVLAVFSLVFAYVFYSARTAQEQELVQARQDLTTQEGALQRQAKDLNDLLLAIGYNDPQLKKIAGGAEGQAVTKLDDLLKQKLTERDDLVKQIGVAVTDVDTEGKSVYLDKTINAGLAAGTTPAELSGTLVGQIIDALREAAKNRQEHQTVVNEGEGNLKQLNQSILTKEDEVRKTIRDWDEKIRAAWDARVATRDKLIADRKVWTAEEVDLNQKLALAQDIRAKVEAREATQKDMGTPADGKVIAYDWKNKVGSINLGSNDGVKAGYQFDVFRRYPGADTAERRTYMAKITLIDVKPDVSLFMQIPSDYDKAGVTMAEGDYVANRVLNEYQTKHYYIAGYFPRGSDYDRQSLAGLVKDSGGILQDRLTLDTNYVIVGVIDPGTMTDWSDEAKKDIEKAKADYDLARRYDIEVLSVDKFLSLINRK